MTTISLSPSALLAASNADGLRELVHHRSADAGASGPELSAIDALGEPAIRLGVWLLEKCLLDAEPDALARLMRLDGPGGLLATLPRLALPPAVGADFARLRERLATLGAPAGATVASWWDTRLLPAFVAPALAGR